jgi:SAM-dependent methyltransferase
MPQNVFVGRVAHVYDAVEQLNSRPAAVEPAVSFLADLAHNGPVLEFAIGTGRIALPLQERGVDVVGIEISEDMVDQLRRKPGGEAIPVVIGDMATTQVEPVGGFSLVYLVYNTISNLLDQAEQVACFANAAAHLAPGGVFVIELGIPQIRKVAPGENSHAFDLSPVHLGFDTYDFANQRVTSHHYWPNAHGPLTAVDSHHRYAWPAELDLMAQIAGLRLRERYGDWSRSEFTGESTQHISVWEKPLAQ